MSWKWWDSLEPQKTLFETSAIRLSIIVPILFSMGAALLIFLDPNVGPTLGVESFEQIKSIYKNLTIPFIIAGLSIPITALFSGHHRTLQTRRQIEIQDQQNVFSNYVKHRDLFINFLDSTKPFHGEIKSPNEIYEEIYSESPAGDLKPNRSVVLDVSVFVHQKYQNILNDISDPSKVKDYNISSEIAVKELIELHKFTSKYRKQENRKEYETKDFDEQGTIHAKKIVIETHKTMKSLFKCCNFLQTYVKDFSIYSSSIIESQILSEIEKISPNFYFIKNTKDAVERYSSKPRIFGDQLGDSQLKSALEDCQTNSPYKSGTYDDLANALENVLFPNLTATEKSAVVSGMPDFWKEAIQLGSWTSNTEDRE